MPTFSVSSCCQGLPGPKGMKGEPSYEELLPGVPVRYPSEEMKMMDWASQMSKSCSIVILLYSLLLCFVLQGEHGREGERGLPVGFLLLFSQPN